MNRLIKPLLLITLAAFSFFSLSADYPAYVSPKVQGVTLYSCYSSRTFLSADSKMTLTDCYDWVIAQAQTFPGRTFSSPSSGEPDYEGSMYLSATENVCNASNECYNAGINIVGRASNKEDLGSKICPPDDAPMYKKGPMTAPDGTEDVCLPNIPLCPDGYYNFEIGGSCLPVQCPESGTQMQGNIQTYGKLGLTSAGTWCDGICSYNVQSGSIDYAGSKWASGTSTGKVCGGGKVESNSNFTSVDEENTCNDTIIPTGGLFQNCSTSEQEQPDPDSTVGGDDAPLDNNLVDTTPDAPFTPQDCVVDGSEITCVGSNIVDALNDRASKQKENDDERHNKLVQQQKDVADYLEKKENEREAIRLANQDVLINSVNALGTTISSGSTSNADMTGVEAGLTALGDSIGQTDVET
ncbi:hypothetical protein, partial [Shewanella sp. SG41-3]|uniref:hypothetical protein n=1 Tax=Shewanella sp. SG41-3 TaxID=2760977 RepID=UPI0015FFDB03